MSNMTRETSLSDSHFSKKQLIKKDIELKRSERSCNNMIFKPVDHEMYLEMKLGARFGKIFVDNRSRIHYLMIFLQERNLLQHIRRNEKLDLSNPELGFISLLKAGGFDKMTCKELVFLPWIFPLREELENFKHYNQEIFPKRKDLLCGEHFLLYFLCVSESLARQRFTYRNMIISYRENKFLLDSISKLCQKSKHDSKKIARLSEMCEKLAKPIKTIFPIGKFINLSKLIKMKSFRKIAYDTQLGKERICKKNELSQLISETSKFQDKCVDSDLEIKNSTLAKNNPDVASNLLTRYKTNTRGVLKDIMATNSLKLKYLEVNDIKPKFNKSVFSIYLFELGVKCVEPLNSKLKRMVFDMPNFLQVSSSKIPAIETWPKKSDECKKGELMPYVSTLSTLQDEYFNSDLHEEKPVLIEQKKFNASLKKLTENEQSIYWFGKDGMCTKDSDDQERLTIKEIQPDFNYSLFNSYWIGEILIPKTVERKIRELISPVSPILTLQCKQDEFMPYISTLSTLQEKYFNSDLHTVKSALTEEENLNKSLKKSLENEPSICNIWKDGMGAKNSDKERPTFKEIQPEFNYSLFKRYWTGEIVFPKTIERKSHELVSPSPIMTLKAKCLEFILEYEKSASLNKNPNIGLNYFAWNQLSIRKVVEDSSCIINCDVDGEQLIHESNNSDFTNHLLQQDEILPLKHEVLLVENLDVPLSLLSEEDKIIRPSSKGSSKGKLSLKSNCPEIKESYDSKMDFLPDFQYACECSSCPFESFCEYCETYVRQSLFGLFSIEEQPMETSFHCIACATCCNRDGKLYFECGHYSCFQCFSSKFENWCKPLDTTVCIKCKNEFSKFVPNYFYGIEECVQTRVLYDWYEVWTLKQNDTEMQMPSSSFRNCNYISVC